MKYGRYSSAATEMLTPICEAGHQQINSDAYGRACREVARDRSIEADQRRHSGLARGLPVTASHR